MKQTKNLLLVLMALIIVFLVVFIFQKTDKADSLMRNSEILVLDEEEDIEWKTYTDNSARFTIDYPDTWNYEVLTESNVGGTTESGEKIWFGQMVLTGPEGVVGLAYGDGFGGPECGAKGGVLETFTANGEEFELCKIQSTQIDPSTEYEYIWTSCGDCGLLQKTDAGQRTTYIFSIESDSSDLQGTPIPQIISSLTFRYK